LPLLYRNAQVGAIWEGTTNVLALDAWRAISKENALAIYYELLKKRLQALPLLPNELADAPAKVQAALDKVASFAKQVASNKQLMEATARYFAFAFVNSLKKVKVLL